MRKTRTHKYRRLLALLDCLPLQGRHGASPSDLARKMASIHGEDEYLDPEGYASGTGAKRLQRDLKALEEMFGPASIIKDDSYRNRPLFWRSAGTKLPGLDIKTALAFSVAGDFLRQVLPPAFFSSLAEHFMASEQVLQQQTKIAQWRDRIAVIPRGLPLLAPRIDPRTHDTVLEALFEERKLALRYRKKWESSATEYPEIDPAGIIVRGTTSYLVGFKPSDQTPRQFAMHRIEQTAKLSQRSRLPVDFALQAFASSGALGFLLRKKPIALKLKITSEAAENLREMPLHSTQRMSLSDDRQFLLLEASLPWTQELEWWLLGLADAVQVIRPAALAQRILRAHAAAAEKYSSR